MVWASPPLKNKELRSGTLPADTAATDAGNLLVEIALPSDWLETAATGVKTIKGIWTGTGTAAAGETLPTAPPGASAAFALDYAPGN